MPKLCDGLLPRGDGGRRRHDVRTGERRGRVQHQPRLPLRRTPSIDLRGKRRREVSGSNFVCVCVCDGRRRARGGRVRRPRSGARVGPTRQSESTKYYDHCTYYIAIKFAVEVDHEVDITHQATLRSDSTSSYARPHSKAAPVAYDSSKENALELLRK